MELYYALIADEYKECSLTLPPNYRTRCRERATHAVLDNSSWYWRCTEHKNVRSIRPDGSVEEGTFSAFYPKVKK